jgi:hypothetical protein
LPIRNLGFKKGRNWQDRFKIQCINFYRLNFSFVYAIRDLPSHR